MMVRVAVLSACLLGGAAVLASLSRPPVTIARQSFQTFPPTVGRWSEAESQPLAPDVLKVLGVDDYMNRVYAVSPRDYAALYIGYYRAQRQDDQIHSPLNCLPGSGWEPIARQYTTVLVPGAPGQSSPLRVNRLLVEKGIDRQLVLYWYQSHGRVVPNEYWSKAYMVYDAIRLNRTDAALVRISVPLPGNDEGAERQADENADDFVRSIYPQLDRYIPS
jgi:EpsI family protein